MFKSSGFRVQVFRVQLFRVQVSSVFAVPGHHGKGAGGREVPKFNVARVVRGSAPVAAVV